MEKYTKQLVDEVISVGPGYEGYIFSVAKLTDTDLDAEEISEEAWSDVNKSLEEANRLIDQDYTLELCEFARDKWDIRLRRVYMDGNQIDEN